MKFKEEISSGYSALLKAHRIATPKGDSSIASGALLLTNGHVETYPTRGCHAFLNQPMSKDNKIIGIVSELQASPYYSKIKEADKEKAIFIDYLVNRSAFRSMFFIKDIDQIMSDGVLYAHTQVTNNLLAAGFICSRFTSEHWQVCHIFSKLLKAGLNEDQAFLTAPIFYLYNNQFSLKNLLSYHSGIAPGYMHDSDIKAYLAAEPIPATKGAEYLVSPTYKNIDNLFCAHAGYSWHKNEEDSSGSYYTVPKMKDAFWSKIASKLSGKDITEGTIEKSNPFTSGRSPVTSKVKHPMHVMRPLSDKNIQVIADIVIEIFKEIK
jgi:hypothetical protein